MATVPRLHLVMDDRVAAEPGFLDVAARLMEIGGPRLAVHLRAPEASGAKLFHWGEALVEAAGGTGALVLVNDRADVALATGADGVQLPGRGLPFEAARRLLGEGALIGGSVHSAEEAAAAQPGADFLLVGTVFASASHPGRAPAGTALLSELAPLGVPMVAIGGMTPARVPGVLAAGAHGVAVLGAVWHAPDPARAVRELLELL